MAANVAALDALLESLTGGGELDLYRAAVAQTARTLAEAMDAGVAPDRLATVARAYLVALDALSPEGSDENDADAGLSSPVRNTT